MLMKLTIFSGLAILLVQGCVCVFYEDENVCADCIDTMRNFTSLEEMLQYNLYHDDQCDYQHAGYCKDANYICATLVSEPRCAWNGRKFRNFSSECAMSNFNHYFYDRYDAISNCLCNSGANKLL